MTRDTNLVTNIEGRRSDDEISQPGDEKKLLFT